MIRCLLVLSLLCSAAVFAQTMSATVPPVSASVEWPLQDGAFDIANFHFHDGETIGTLHLHYLTLGTLHRDSQGHTDNAILLLHGTGGSARSKLAPQFSKELFGPGQPLDITKYFLIFPDDIGHGSPANPPMDSTCNFRRTTTTTWSSVNTPCFWTVFTSTTCV